MAVDPAAGGSPPTRSLVGCFFVGSSRMLPMLPPGAGLGLILFLGFFGFASCTALFSSPLIGFSQDMHGVTVSACARFPFVLPCSDRAAGAATHPPVVGAAVLLTASSSVSVAPMLPWRSAAGAGLVLFLVRFFVFRSVFVFGLSSLLLCLRCLVCLVLYSIPPLFAASRFFWAVVGFSRIDLINP